jgi:hypothetical protein
MTKPTPEAALLANLAQLGVECDEQQARFARCCAALGAEIGKRQRAERQRDELLEACRGLLTCSLPVDISGQRFVDAARAAIAKATEGVTK